METAGLQVAGVAVPGCEPVGHASARLARDGLEEPHRFLGIARTEHRQVEYQRQHQEGALKLAAAYPGASTTAITLQNNGSGFDGATKPVGVTEQPTVDEGHLEVVERLALDPQRAVDDVVAHLGTRGRISGTS
ncbi:MAG: hypothetical protein OXR73_25595 [Myxococcales bacterium]|nr:hypothetical protein [Myxococcales bacterium]